MFGIQNRWYSCRLVDNEKDKLIRGINQILHVYEALSLDIDCFTVGFRLGDESACHIDSWISWALRMRVRKIDLALSNISPNYGLYNFPCHLLPCGKSSSLKHLCLETCLLKPSNFIDQFSSLKTLDLNNVPLDASDIQSIHSCCLNLESWRLETCNLPETLTICDQLRHLKILSLRDCYGLLSNIVISSSSLKTFDYRGKVKIFIFVGVPCLEKLYMAFLHPFAEGSEYMYHGIARDLPCLKSLQLVFFEVCVGVYIYDIV